MLQPNQRLGDFEIIRLLGKGGMGEVYEAQQHHPQRRVALKVLAPWLAEDQQALDRFWREAEVPAQLDHPGVVRIFSTGKSEQHAYYAMQLVRGISLSDLLRKVHGPQPDTIAQGPAETSRSESDSPEGSGESPTIDLPSTDNAPPVIEEFRQDRFATLARIGLHAAQALDSAHRQGFLHRDIKPSNIMIDQHNQLYLVDFGLTKALHSATATRTGIVIGTPWFMSPEQAGGHPLDGRSDIYSLGVTLYQLATGGKGPYRARHNDTDEILRAVRSAKLFPVSQLAPAIPAPLERIITRAIQVDAEQRYQSAAELASDLKSYLQGAPLAPTPLPARATAPTAARRWAIGATMFGAAAAIALIVIWQRQARDLSDKPNGPGLDPATLQGKASDNGEGAVKSDPLQRDHPLGVRLNLLREDHQPVLHRILVGEGSIQSLPTELVLQSKGDKPFFVALDDPKLLSYDLALEWRPAFQGAPGVNDLGMFIGWRDQLADPRSFMRFFVLKLDKRPVGNDTWGRVYCGTWQFSPPRGAVFAPEESDLRPLFKIRPWIALAAPQPDGVWHKLSVMVRGRKFTVAIDSEPLQEFDIDAAVRGDKFLGGYDLDCRGILGIWVRGGVGHFRNISLVTRPSQ